MSLVIKLLEALAEQTWDRIKDGYELGISQGEETITDFNLLEIKRAGITEIKVAKTSKDDEAIRGIDWEWWIGSNSLGWLRYAVQAKKISVPSQRYESLKHEVNGILQIDLLDVYAKKVSAIPLYCFYNYSKDPIPNEHWQCGIQYQEKQLGCTVTPSSTVRHAINSWGCRNFDFVHKKHDTIPWRCLLKCPRVLDIYSGRSTDIGFNNVRVYRALPTYLASAITDGQPILLSESYPMIKMSEFGEIVQTDKEPFVNKSSIRIVPRKILVIYIRDQTER